MTHISPRAESCTGPAPIGALARGCTSISTDLAPGAGGGGLGVDIRVWVQLSRPMNIADSLCFRLCMIAPSFNCNVEERMMAKRPANNGAGWSAGELRTLKQLAKSGTAQAAAKQLGRTPAAVQQKAMRTGISFRAAPRGRGRAKKK
jgi:hypothetical protein